MKQEDKNAILQFMGQVYGESKQNDQMLINSSTNLQPKSDQIKNVFEKTLRENVQQNPQPNQPAPRVEPVMQAPSDAPVQTGLPVHITPVDEQLEFDLKEPDKFDMLLNLIKEQNNIISSIHSSIKLIVKKIDTPAKKVSTRNAKNTK